MAVFHRALDADYTITDFFNFTDVGNKRDAQIFREFRPDLPGIAVDGLPAANNQVVVFNFFDSFAQGSSRGQCIRTGKSHIAQ